MRRILSTDAAVVAKVDALGKITLGDDPGQPVGLARSTGEVYADEAGAGRVAAVDASGWVTDADYDRVGNIDASGLVRDRAGTIVGKVEEPVDGAVLLMILSGRLHASTARTNDDEPGDTLMDEAQAIGEQTTYPGVRKGYAPLGDDEVFFRPKEKF